MAYKILMVEDDSSIAAGLSYMLSGYYGLYSSQKIMYSKLKAEYINKDTK